MSKNTPSSVKYRKTQKGNQGQIRGISYSDTILDKGEYGLMAVSAARVKASQIESVRRVVVRSLGKKGKLFISVFAQKNFTKKAAETRMGSGKGSPEVWVALVRPGQILFQLTGVSFEEAKQAFDLAGYKLSVKAKMIQRSCYE